MVKDPETKFIFTVRENSECDDGCNIPFVVWNLNDDIRARLSKLANIAKTEDITVVTNEFLLYDGADMSEPLTASLSLTGDEDPILDLQMQMRVKNMWPVDIIAEKDIPLTSVMMAMAPPTHLKRPVAVVLPDCDTDLLVFDAPEDPDELHELVTRAVEIFQGEPNGQKAIIDFSNETGVGDLYRYTKTAPNQEASAS